MRYEGELIACASEGCPASMKGHAWARIKTEGWFHSKDGESFCPEHVPEWVPAWRESRRRRKVIEQGPS